MSDTEQTTALTPALNAQSALAEMTQTGQLDKYLYSFKQGGKEICDLNTSGINSLAIAQGVSIDGVSKIRIIRTCIENELPRLIDRETKRRKRQTQKT